MNQFKFFFDLYYKYSKNIIFFYTYCLTLVSKYRENIIIFYTYCLALIPKYLSLYRWFDFLLPLYFKIFWQNQQTQQTWLFFICTNCIEFIQFVFNILKFIIKYAYTAYLHDWVVLFTFAQYLYVIARISFFVRVRLYFYLIFYLLIFLFNFYLLWSLLDLCVFFSKKGLLGDSYGIDNMCKILHSDFTPYNFYENNRDLVCGRRFFRFKMYDPTRWVSIYTIPDSSYYDAGLFFLYHTYYIILLFFLTLLHILFRLKHLFDDYLRDFDKNLVVFYYYVFCFICLYFFFCNLEQISVYILNFFNLDNLLYFIIVYIFFIFIFGILLFNIAVLSANRSKKKLNLNFVFYALLTILMCFLFFTFSSFIQDKFIEFYLYVLFSYVSDSLMPQYHYLVFYELTPKIPEIFPTYLDTCRRKVYQKHLTLWLELNKKTSF